MLRLQYFYNIFTTNHRWLVVIGLNLKLTLRLFFFVLRITISNNLPLKICCENVVDISFFFFKQTHTREKESGFNTKTYHNSIQKLKFVILIQNFYTNYL